MSGNQRQYRHGHGSDAQHLADQALFGKLMAFHDQLERTTEVIPNGIRSRTTSANPDLAKTLQDHVVSMEKRFAGGRAIRSWDPLFAALFEYKDQIDMQYYNIKNGVEAVLTSDDPKVVELIQCHDQTLHNFVERGGEAGREQSPKPDWLD